MTVLIIIENIQFVLNASGQIALDHIIIAVDCLKNKCAFHRDIWDRERLFRTFHYCIALVFPIVFDFIPSVPDIRQIRTVNHIGQIRCTAQFNELVCTVTETERVINTKIPCKPFRTAESAPDQTGHGCVSFKPIDGESVSRCIQRFNGPSAVRVISYPLSPFKSIGGKIPGLRRNHDRNRISILDVVLSCRDTEFQFGCQSRLSRTHGYTALKHKKT